MEDKLNELMNDGDYYSAHQLILSLTKRKVKVGKISEAVEFVKNGVARLCQASQFASASDAAMSIFEYATESNFPQMREMFSQLLNSSDAHHWKKFLNEMGKENILDNSEKKGEILDSLFASNSTGNAEKLSAIANLILQLSGEARKNYIEKYSQCLTSQDEFIDLNIYFISEFSLILTKECQFYDNEYFLRCISASINGEENDHSESIVPVGLEQYRLFNFCVLMNYLCQKKSPPKSIFTQLLNEYLPESLCKTRSDLSKLRSFAEHSLSQTFWPAPKARGGPNADLMNMLQGLLGPQMRH